MDAVVRVAAEYLLLSAAVGITGLLLLVAFTSPSLVMLVLFAIGTVFIGYYYVNYWR